MQRASNGPIGTIMKKVRDYTEEMKAYIFNNREKTSAVIAKEFTEYFGVEIKQSEVRVVRWQVSPKEAKRYFLSLISEKNKAQ